LVSPLIVTGEVGGDVEEEAKAHSLHVELFVEKACSYLVIVMPPLNVGASKAIERKDAPGVEDVIVGAPGSSFSPK
jgi:hypothetical protein